MFKDQSRRFKLETVLAMLSGVLGVVTLFWHDWLEVTGMDPDHHNGSAEWIIAVALLLVALLLGALARREYRHGALSAA